MEKNKLKSEFLNKSGSFSGALSFLGSYQVCHNLCIGIISLLTAIGITIVGMPLLFLTKIALPFWIAAVSLLLIISLLTIKKIIHISKNSLMFNSGLIIAGTPFLQNYNKIIWPIGGILVLMSIIAFIKNKISKRKNEKN